MNAIKFALAAALFAVTLPLASCSDDDDNDIRPSKVPEAVKEAFSDRYPSVRYVDWDKVKNYYVAEFVHDGFDRESWFKADGAWTMTQTDYNNNISYLPVLMQDAFNNSAYASWEVDDVDYYERVADTFCAIDVESRAQGDMTIYIDNMGNILNVTPDIDDDIYPETNVEAL